MKKKFTMLFAALLAVVGVAKADVTDLPEITTDLENPIYYTIKNVRGNAYAAYDGAAHAMKLSNVIDNAAYLFYFTEGVVSGTYKIHNAVTNNKCAAPNSWTAEGIDWYIKESGNTGYSGFAIATQETLTDGGNTNEAWNDFQNVHTSIATYGGNDAGSVWAIDRFEGDIPVIQLSTEGNVVLHYIRSIRRDSYVNFEQHNSQFKEGSLGLGSYWYFVQDEEKQQEAPEGFIACRIFNAAHATAVENFTSGFMETETWPAKVFYIGFRENNRFGYIIRTKDDDSKGWHDFNGSYIGSHGLEDDGSLWRIYPADKTESQLKSEAATAKTNALALITDAEYADYYTYSDEAIATAKAAIENATSADLVSAVLGHMAIDKALATLEASEKGTTGPAVGDIIQLKNRKDNKYLKSNAADAENTNSKNDLATLWRVEEGDEGNVRLKNVSTNKYMGQITRSTTVVMQEDVANAAQFSWTNQTGVYAVFKDVTGGNYAYGHVNGGKLVGWTAGETPTQWAVSNVRPLTITYLYNDETLSTATEVVEYGTTYTISSSYDFTTVVACSVNGEALEATEGVFSFVVDAEAEVVVEIAESLPFEAAADVNSINTWYYVKMHTNYPGYLGDIADDMTIDVANGKSSDKANENYVWGFVGNVFDGITVVNKGTGLQLTSTGSGNATLTAEGTAFFVARTSATSANAEKGFCLRRSDSKNYLNANYTDEKLSHWGSTDAGSTFFLTEYEEAEVTVSDVDWATMYLGYATYIPEGVNVYAVTGVENNYVTLTQIEGVIPANTGVLLENAGEYTFVKAAKDNATVAGNLLQGSVADTYVEGTAYVLSAKKGIGLYKAELNKDANGNDGETHFLNNANKAYLPAPTGANAAMFSFSRGGDEDTTSIDDVELTNDNVVIYDLAGRRVEKMEKGIYIVNGKKVIK